MSWTGKGGDHGPWGGKPSPEKSGPSAGGPPPGKTPDFEDALHQLVERLKQFLSGGGRSMVLIVLGILLLWFASGIYRIDATEQGVVLRFGQYHHTTDPGLHYHLPYPIETVYSPNVTNVNSVEIGGPSSSPRNAGTIENQMLTGDMNIIEINFEVQWRIKPMQAEKFLFNLRNAEDTVKPVAESAMREVVGTMKLEDILTTGQTEIATRTQDILQKALDGYDAGIEVVSVNLSKPDVPDDVIQAFQDVKRAEQDRETTVSVAERYRNEIMPKASGEAEKMNQDAIAYKSQVTAQAQGDASRFLAVLAQYEQAKDVTKQRIYLETMADVFEGMPKTILDAKGVLPYLPLPGAKGKAAPAPESEEQK